MPHEQPWLDKEPKYYFKPVTKEASEERNKQMAERYVRIRTWDDMFQEFGGNSQEINVQYNFTAHMEKDMPSNRIIKINGTTWVPEANTNPYRNSYNISPEMIADDFGELLPESYFDFEYTFKTPTQSVFTYRWWVRTNENPNMYLYLDGTVGPSGDGKEYFENEERHLIDEAIEKYHSNPANQKLKEFVFPQDKQVEDTTLLYGKYELEPAVFNHVVGKWYIGTKCHQGYLCADGEIHTSTQSIDRVMHGYFINEHNALFHKMKYEREHADD